MSNICLVMTMLPSAKERLVLPTHRQGATDKDAGIRLEVEKILHHRHSPNFTDCRLVVHGGEECGATAEMTPLIVSCVADGTEFASRYSVEWCGSHQGTTTCSTGVQSFCVRWCSDVAKMCKAPENAIFVHNFAMRVTPASNRNGHFIHQTDKYKAQDQIWGGLYCLTVQKLW